MNRWGRGFLVSAVLIVSFGGPVILLGCLWDRDTLEMERQRFPSALELIAGKFLRHSEAFYRWRIEDRLTRLQADPNNLQWRDDLAVAYDKLGQHEQAIDAMLAKQQLRSDQYETEANLGTFYIHAGKLEEGLEHIKKALQINPNAHFGRERTQQRLVEYLLSKKAEGEPIKLPLEAGEAAWEPFGFSAFVLDAEQIAADDLQGRRDAVVAATKGVLGMMRFGRHDSPVLLETLGDLLRTQLDGEGEFDGKLLAARAYLRAAGRTSDPTGRKAYRKKAEAAVALHRDVDLAEVERALQHELEDAERWVKAVHADELRWIAEASDVEAEFARKYYREPTVNSPSAAAKPEPDGDDQSPWGLIGCGVLGLSLLAGSLVVARWWRPKGDVKLR